MRVTNSILNARALQTIQKTLVDMEAQTRKITSGLEVENASDDPTSVGGIMQSSSSLRALDQYRDNLSLAQSRLTAEDGILEQLSNVMIRARELGVSQQGHPASADTRLITKEEIDGIGEFVRELGNTQFAGGFLFGGDYADTRPFPPGGPDPLKPPEGTLRVEGGSGNFLNVNHSGQEIFVDTGVMAALEDLSAGLAANSEDDILSAMTDLSSAYSDVQELVGDLGARMSHVDMASSNVDAMEITLQTFRSDLQDVELEEALTELVAMQTTYEAALMANARIISTTLTDYLMSTHVQMEEEDGLLLPVESEILGSMAVSQAECLTFPEGILGFPACHRFILVPTSRRELFWLQSVEFGSLAFLLVDPFTVVDEFSVDISEADLAPLRPIDPNQMGVLAIVTLPQKPGVTATANLQGLLAIDFGQRLGKQVVMPESEYGIRWPVEVQNARMAS